VRGALAAVLMVASGTAAAEEISLFDARGRATAYIAEDLTIYMWGGKPVVYLDRDSGGGFHVYGFNGKHLGWFTQGLIRDHEGNAACAVKDAIRTTELEPLKSLKELKPLKDLKDLAPLRTLFSSQWSEAPCRFFLLQGGAS
jgi:hypothetical protein